MGETLPAEDTRISQARKALAAARAAVDDYTTPYAPQIWAARLDVALETLLGYVDETAPGGQLDRVDDRLENLGERFDQMVRILTVAAADEANHAPAQLDRIEERIGRIERVLTEEMRVLGDALSGSDEENGR